MDLVYNYVIPLTIMIIFIVLFVIISTKKYKDAPESKKMFPIKILYFSLLVFEIFKIAYLISKDGVFTTSRYPIVFCSMIFYTIPLFCFKENKFSNVAKAFTIFPSIIAFILFVAIQHSFKMSLIQGHSYYYHGAMMAIAIYLITSKSYKFEFKGFYSLFLSVSGYIMFAMVLSLLLKSDISYFGPNCSYLGFLYKNFGYAVGNVLLIIVIFILCLLVYGIISIFNKKKVKVEKEEI